MAAFFPSITPYHFGFNNPVSFNDPTGLAPEDATSEASDNTDAAGGGDDDPKCPNHDKKKFSEMGVGRKV